MSSKRKGIDAERELVHLFWSKKWVSARVAGSGSSRYPSCDILASNNERKLAIECKTTKEEIKYFEKKDVRQFKEFAYAFGAEPWVAIKFKKSSWFFLSLDDLKETKKCFVVNRILAEKKGLLFEELVEV